MKDRNTEAIFASVLEEIRCDIGYPCLILLKGTGTLNLAMELDVQRNSTKKVSQARRGTRDEVRNDFAPILVPFAYLNMKERPLKIS